MPGRVYVSEALQGQLMEEMAHYRATGNSSFIPALHQIGNAAALPGVVGASIGLPDIHCGYGFAIGHVAAFDMDDPEAVVTPGGVGFDINCGVRMLRTNLHISTLRPHQEALADAIYGRVPVGVGGRNKAHGGGGGGGTVGMNGSPDSDEVLSLDDLRDLMRRGMDWACERNLAWPEDVARCEERGRVPLSLDEAGGAPQAAARQGGALLAVSQRAEARGLPQLGTLGSGNHYVEVQAVTDIYDAPAAAAMGITAVGQVCVMIHCGSRGLGHQLADDAIKSMAKVMERDAIVVNDAMLACTRIRSAEGRAYLAGMAAASNFAYVNRSVIAHRVRDAFASVFGRSPRDLEMHVVYDVSHNIAKVEEHVVDGARRRLLVHRKGATRAFPPHHPDLPAEYAHVGQPVLVGGSMGTCSYVLTGTARGMQETFGSTCHGAGRAHGRNAMKKMLTAEEVLADLAAKGISIRVGDAAHIAEEAPESYKDVTAVVDVCKCALPASRAPLTPPLGHDAGISKKAFRLQPICVIKG